MSSRSGDRVCIWCLALLLGSGAIVACSADKKEEVRPSQAEAPADDSRRDTVRFWESHRAGMDARQRGRWQEAVGAFRMALQIRPEHETAHYYLASALFETGDYLGAVRHWEEILTHHPMSSRANVQLAAVHAIPDLPELFDLQKARTHLERALELNPEETGPLIRLGEIEVASGHQTRGRELLEHARLTNPRASSAHYLCAYLAWKAGDAEQAQTDLALALESLATSHRAATPMLEGDVREGDDETVAEETMSRRRLFANLLEDFSARGETSPAEEAARISAYLAGLPASPAAN